MGQIVSIINPTCSDTLQSVFKEAKEQEGGKSEVEMWKTEFGSDREQLINNQGTNGEDY